MSPPRTSPMSLPVIVTTPPPSGYAGRSANPSSAYTLAASGNSIPLPSPKPEPDERSYASLAASAYDAENVLRDLSIEEQRKLMASSPPKDLPVTHHQLAGTWNERFQNLLESPIKVQRSVYAVWPVLTPQTPKDCQKRAQLLQKLVDEFVVEARGNVETIVKELPLPVAKKTIVPMNEKAGFMGGAKYIHVRSLTQHGEDISACLLAR